MRPISCAIFGLGRGGDGSAMVGGNDVRQGRPWRDAATDARGALPGENTVLVGVQIVPVLVELFRGEVKHRVQHILIGAARPEQHATLLSIAPDRWQGDGVAGFRCVGYLIVSITSFAVIDRFISAAAPFSASASAAASSAGSSSLACPGLYGGGAQRRQ